MGIRDILRKLLNPGAVSQPPPSKTPEVAVPSGVAAEPQENAPVAETVAPPTPEQVEQPVAVEKPEVGLGTTTETEPGGAVQSNVEGKSAQSEGVASTPQSPGTGDTLP